MYPVAITRPRLFLCLPLLFSVLSCDLRAQHREARLEQQRRASAIVSSMDTATLAAQVLLTGIDGATLSSSGSELLGSIPVGAVMLFKYNLGKGAEGARRLTEAISATVRGSLAASGVTPVAPFIAVDHEGGGVHRFGDDLTRLPNPRDFRGDAASVRESADLSARELALVGISLNLAPVAEAVGEGNRGNSFMYERSYSSNAAKAARLAGEFVRGMDREGIACTIKHFPGNSAVDPHKGGAVLSCSMAELEKMMEPFQEVSRRADPAAVMVSHAVVTAIDPDNPGTLSKKLIQGYLKEHLGFPGIVISDDLRMAAISSTGRSVEVAAVEAVSAGVDLVMVWPSDLVHVHDEIVKAVADGRLSRQRLVDAATRVMAARLRYGLDRVPQHEGAKQDIVQELELRRTETDSFLRARGLR